MMFVNKPVLNVKDLVSVKLALENSIIPMVLVLHVLNSAKHVLILLFARVVFLLVMH